MSTKDHGSFVSVIGSFIMAVLDLYRYFHRERNDSPSDGSTSA